VGSATSIQATVPAGATTGPLSVTTPGGTATTTSNFIVQLSLTAAKAGNGSGTVTSNSSPPINCGDTCSAFYDSGSVVVLTATPATGSDLTGWNGCDSVSGATCTVTMNAARAVTATFTLQRFTLTARKSGLLGNGTITSASSPDSSPQISCGSTCAVSYDYGTVVNLRVAPNFLSIFTGWTGCDSASGTSCTVTIKAARTVTANFL
jgi:hypothetical protein